MSKLNQIKDKISNNKLIKASLGFTIASLLTRAIGFLTTPIFSRLMEPEAYGVYNTYLAYESILYLFIGLALHSSIQNAKYDFEYEFEEYISSIITIIIINLGVFLLIGNVFYPIIGEITNLNIILVNLLIIHSFSSAIIQILQARMNVDYNYKKYLLFSIYNAFTNILISIVMIVTIFKHDKGIGRIIGNFIPIFLAAILVIIYFFLKSKPRYNRVYWKYALKFSLPIIPHGISQIILNQFDRIMIQRIIGSYFAGLYSFAYSIAGISATITNSLQTVYTPWFYSQMNLNSDEGYKNIKEGTSKYITVIFLFSTIVMLISPEILSFMGPEEYYEARHVCIPILVGTFYSAIYTIPIQIEYYYKQTKYIAITTCSAALINLILNLIFIPKFGYIAAAYTTLISYIIYFVFHYIIAIKIHGSVIYDNKVILLVSLGILIIGIIATIFIDMLVARLLMILIIFIICLKPLLEFIRIKKEQ